MTPAEAQVLLSMAAAFDNRRPDPDAARAWSAALDGLRFDDCRDALIEHYKTSTDYLMPVLIRTAVRRIRSKRIAEAGALTPPPDLTPVETNRWLAEARSQIANGTPVDQVTTDHGGALTPRNLGDLRAICAPPEEP